MQQVKWAEFELQELFEVKTSKKRFDANKVKIEDIGYPYVVRTATNNGIKGRLNEDEEYLNEGNTISFGQDTATMFYQEKPYFTGDKIKILKPKLASFNKKNAQFFIPIMTRAFSSFSWGSSSFSEKIIKFRKLSLPIKPNINLDKLAQIDFDFMENFISQLEAFRLSQLEAYLLVTGLKNYTLTTAEKQALADFENGKIVFWGCELQELFEVKTSKKRFDANKVKIENIGYPYVVRTATNNGIKGCLNEDEEYLNEGNTISFGQDTATMFYQEKPYFTGDKIKILKSKYASFNKKNAQFFISIMTRAFSSFSWGSSSFSEKIIKSQKIFLPIKPNTNLDKLAQIDFDFMETLISAVQKLVIKEVVLYADRKIETTKKVIAKHP